MLEIYFCKKWKGVVRRLASLKLFQGSPFVGGSVGGAGKPVGCGQFFPARGA